MTTLAAYLEQRRHRHRWVPLDASEDFETCAFCGAVRPVQQPETD